MIFYQIGVIIKFSNLWEFYNYKKRMLSLLLLINFITLCRMLAAVRYENRPYWLFSILISGWIVSFFFLFINYFFIISGKNGWTRDYILVSIIKETSIADFLESTKIEGDIFELNIFGYSSFSSYIYVTIKRLNGTPSWL